MKKREENLPLYAFQRRLIASHIGIVRPIPALRCGPVDVLARVFDIASLAMHAVLEIDLELGIRALANHLIDACRTIALRGFVKFRQIDRNRN